MTMNDVSETELEALRVGGERAGAYLDSINKTDLADLTAEEWDEFLSLILCGYSERIRELTSEAPPF